MSSIVKARHLTWSMVEASHKQRENPERKGHLANEHKEEPLDPKPQVDIAEIKVQAQAMMEAALKNTREISEAAEKKGYEEGYLRGLVDGASESFKAGEENIMELRRLIELIQQERLQLIRREEKSLLEISLQMCKKIIRRSVQVDENVLAEMIKEVIHEQEGKIKIHVSEYQQTLEMKIDKELAKKIRSFSKDSKVVFLKEADLILVETPGGVIDLSIPVQLEMMEKTLFEK